MRHKVFAAQLGFQYAPSGDNMLKMFALDYTLVMPYMYTHSQKNNGTISYGTNYQNHTTNGRSLGSQIPPNSDKVNLEFKLSLIGRLKFNMTATLIRHCNVNEFQSRCIQHQGSRIPDKPSARALTSHSNDRQACPSFCGM